MKDFVANRRVSIVNGVAAMSILWGIFVVPSGPPWAGLVWLSALAVLLVATAALFVGTASPSSPSPVVQEAEPKTQGGSRPLTKRAKMMMH